MKISLEELERALKYLKTESQDITIGIEIDTRSAHFVCFDSAGREIKVELYEDGNMTKPKIRRSQDLP